MHSIQIGKITKQYPESIEEMTPQQFLHFSELVLQYQNKEVSFQEFKIRLAYKLLNMDRVVNINTHPEAEKILENINLIANLNDHFFTEKTVDNKNFKVIKSSFINLTPTIKVGKDTFHGPSDALTNTEFGEYVSALNHYVDYSKSAAIEDLDSLVASLYRPKNKNSKSLDDLRIPFDKKLVSYYAKQLSKVPFHIKYGIYLFFSGCQNFIVTSNSLEISGGVTIDLSMLFKQDKSNKKGIGMAGVIYALAETKVFGDAEKTAKQGTYDVLLRMVQVHYQAKEIKKQK